VLCASWPSQATHAQDETERVAAKQLFEQGVVAAANKDWAVATGLFEESLRHAEHPATRFNLVLANDELQRSLEVVRHAWAFLDLAETESRPEARVQVRELVERATRALAVLDMEALRDKAELSVDGHPPQVVHGTLVYLLPGAHVLETRRPGQLVQKAELTLEAGQSGDWPNGNTNASAESPPTPVPSANAQLAPVRVAAPVEAHTQKLETLRYRAAWTVGGVAAASAVAAVALYAAAKLRGEDLAREGSSAAGYPGNADHYGALKNAVAPLAIGSGVLMAGAIALGPRLTQGKSLGWGVAAIASGAALVGLAGAWFAHGPRPLVEGTPVESPVVQAGCLWLGASLPLMTYGVSLLIARARRRPSAEHSFSPLKVVW
jgi:hypothetical protein